MMRTKMVTEDGIFTPVTWKDRSREEEEEEEERVILMMMFIWS